MKILNGSHLSCFKHRPASLFLLKTEITCIIRLTESAFFLNEQPPILTLSFHFIFIHFLFMYFFILIVILNLINIARFRVAKPTMGGIEIDDESSGLNGEVGKNLNRMVPVPHIPRINGDIPSVDEASSDHQRLLDRLRLYNLVETKVQGDGNCQFRALSDQFYQTAAHHEFVRQQIIDQLTSHPEIYRGYVPMAYNDYLRNLSKNGEWGDHVTLQAAADSYGVRIYVFTSFKDTCYIEILPKEQRSNRVIFLSFWAEVHYNSIYPEGEFPNLRS